MSTSSTLSRCERWRAMMSVDVVFPTPPLLWATATTTGEMEAIVGSTPALLSAGVTVGMSRSVSSLSRGNRGVLVTVAPHPYLGVPPGGLPQTTRWAGEDIA